jgi:hypothetical protein
MTIKKTVCLLLFLLSVTTIYAQQEPLRIHTALDYKTNSQYFGLNVGVEYFFGEDFSLAPNFTYWNQNRENLSNLNVDVRYYLTSGIPQLYVMGGYGNYWQPSVVGFRRTRSGGNFGVGANVMFNEKVGFNTEVKLQSQYRRDLVARIGFLFVL